jgi:hypothetical protein
MSGPPYPKAVPGSNGIGQFIIGMSPIGDIPPFDYFKTIISQYSNSPILLQLISDFDENIDQTSNFTQFFDTIFNVDTAVGYGLDVWGRIVGVTRILSVPVGTGNFGFEEAGIGALPFGQGVFFSGGTLTSNFALSDDAFRVLIFAKALANISDGSIKSINQILINLFPNRGNAFVVDGLDMTMQYKFNFFLSPVELAIVGNSGVLPKPVGVSVSVVQPV